MSYNSNYHSVFDINYHMIFCIKYRREVINDEISNCGEYACGHHHLQH